MQLCCCTRPAAASYRLAFNNTMKLYNANVVVIFCSDKISIQLEFSASAAAAAAAAADGTKYSSVFMPICVFIIKIRPAIRNPPSIPHPPPAADLTLSD